MSAVHFDHLIVNTAVSHCIHFGHTFW